MTDYIYRGPYSMVDVIDNDTRKTFVINGDAVSIDNVALIEQHIRRGTHLFEKVEPAESTENGAAL